MNDKQHIERGVGISIIIFTVGSILVLLYSIRQGIFSNPEPVLNTLTVTKSPMQVVYSGLHEEDILPIVDIISKVDFENYNFNSDTNVHIRTDEIKGESNASFIQY